MSSTKGKFWRRRTGSSRMSLVSNHSQGSETLDDVKEEFLHAAEFGDIPTVRRLLIENAELNVDCIDALGRTALRLAVKNEHLEVVEVLLEKSSSRHIYEAVLQAISAGHVQIAESILKHKRYLEIWKDRKKFGDDDHFFKTQFEESQFSPDITPLILSAQKNQYEIVQLLLLRGERIQKPHKFGCLCQECVNKSKFDQLRSAKYRLNAYRGMASDAYISLSSKDPILTAFQLSKELTNLSKQEKYFKQEYKELSNQLSEYVVKLLDRVRTQDELELVLNKTGKASEERYSNLARLKLAVQYREKRFVSHPSCQQRLDKSWFEGIAPFLKAGFFKRIIMIFAFLLVYPFLNIVHIIIPNTKLKALKLLRFPWVKFTMHTASFIAFLLMIIIHTADSTYTFQQNYTLGRLYPAVFRKYETARNLSTEFDFGADLPVRLMIPSPLQMLISIWICGFWYHECVQIYHEGVSSYCASLYNLMDYTMLVVYVTSFALKYLVMFKVHFAIAYLQRTDVNRIVADSSTTQYNLYWIVADRFYWSTWDPVNLSEGLFAVANVLSFSRISYFLPVNAALGPLQISVGRMIKDIVKCLCLIGMVGLAFIVGLLNIFWYYNLRSEIEVEKRDFKVPAEEAFGDPVKTFRSVFWSVFGRGETNVVTLGKYDNPLTENFGYVLYGVYNFIMVTVLINMLIAMMARSFQAIAEESDVEWKFARSILYLEYMGDGEVLPVPLNLVRAPRAMLEWLFDCCDKEEDTIEPPPVELDPYGNELNGDISGLASNGVEDFSSVSQVASHVIRNTNTNGLVSADPSAVDMYEANVTSTDANGKKAPPRRTQKAHVQRSSIPGFMDNSNGYQRVMQRIIQRYIFDIQREAEVTEDDFEEIKQDISSFRYEMLNVLKSREQQLVELNRSLSQFKRSMSTGTMSDASDNEDRMDFRRAAMSKLRQRFIHAEEKNMESRDSYKNSLAENTESENELKEDVVKPEPFMPYDTNVPVKVNSNDPTANGNVRKDRSKDRYIGVKDQKVTHSFDNDAFEVEQNETI